MDEIRIDYLIERYIARELTEVETNELFQLLSAQQSEGVLNVLTEKMETEASVPSIIGQQQTMEMFQRIMSVDKTSSAPTISIQGIDADFKPKVYQIHSIRKWLSVAAVFLLALTGGYFWLAKNPTLELHKSTAKAIDIAPGKQGAILTLADGRQVVLDTLGNQL